tara:strand:+ start:12954 stop:13199 length:246 start_codon:yes stop_codon:yes gene_type:complete
MYEELTECPDCKELATITNSSFNASINCGCGVVEIETMIEEDRLYPVYQQVFGSFIMTKYEDSRIKHSGRLKSLKHRRTNK